ncbi:retrotransposon ORF1 [Tanacetum coccineum]
MKKVDRGITMINHTQVEAMGILTNVLCQVGVTTLIDKFLILDIPIDCDAPIVVGRGFLHTIGGIVNTPKRLFLTFDGFCHQTFRAARSDVMRNTESDSDDEEEHEIKRNKFGAPIYGPKPAPYLNCNDPTEKYAALQEEMMLKPDHRDPNALDNLKPWKKCCFHKFTMNSCYEEVATMRRSLEIDDMLRIKLREAESNEEIFTFVTWIRAFNIKEPIYAELYHEFYSTYEFDEVCADDELQTKKIIKFRLGVRAHNLTLLEFARRLGLYHADELEENRFDVHFQGGLHSDEHFNAQEYWLSISRGENLGLSRSHTSTIRSPILRVIHKMITYGLCQRTTRYANVAWLIARWIKRKGAGNQKESQICYGQFITKIARKARVLTNMVLRSLSAPIYCRYLDTTTLRELIDSEGRLIPEDPLEAYDGETNLGVEENMISNEYAVKVCLEHEVKRGNKIVKKELIVALRGEIYFVKFIINPEEDDVEPGGQVNENALADTGLDINTMPYWIYEQLGREEMNKVDRGITIINHTQAEAMGILINVLCQVGVTTLIAMFLILDIPIDRDAPIVVGWGFLRTIGGIVNTPERLFSIFDGFCHQTFRAARSDVMRNSESDSDDEEEYEIKRNKFGAPIYGPKLAPYLNCNDPAERSLALQTVTNPFWKISDWKKAVSFLGSLPVPLKHVNWKPDYKGSYTKEEEAIGQWRTEIRLTDPYGNIYIQGFTTKKTDRKLSKYHKLWVETMLKPDHRDPNALDNLKPWRRYCFHKFIMSFYYGKVAIMRRILDDEFQSKKIIKFRLGGRAHNLTLLEFARRLGFYHADELEEDGFDVYFQGGLRSDDNFNAQEYWLSISREENLGLSRSHASTIKNPILRVIHKMITYGLCQRTTGYDKIQKNDLWLLSMFDARHQNGYANVAWLIARWVKRKGVGTQKESQICCGQFITDLDTTTLRELIDSEGRLIPEDPQLGMQRVGIPRPLRASM